MRETSAGAGLVAEPLRRMRGRGAPLTGRAALTLILAAALLWSVLQVRWGRDLVHPGGGQVLLRMLQGIVTPELTPALLANALAAAWTTVAYAVAGMTLALLVGTALGLLASGVLLPHSRLRRPSMVAGRVALACLRAVHELVWAWLFVAAIGLTPYAAILALAIPYAGILGRIYAERLNDVPQAPLRALAAAGAGPSKLLVYGRLPAALPDLLGYTFYRFECALRSSAVMGFVGLGGLGFRIQLALDDLRFHQVGTYLCALILLVVCVDRWSSAVRQRLVS